MKLKYLLFSFVKNIGNDNSGTHCDTTDYFTGELITAYNFKKISTHESVEARMKFEQFFKSNKKSILLRLLYKVFGHKGISK